jgi:hypothetical protein
MGAATKIREWMRTSYHPDKFLITVSLPFKTVIVWMKIMPDMIWWFSLQMSGHDQFLDQNISKRDNIFIKLKIKGMFKMLNMVFRVFPTHHVNVVSYEHIWLTVGESAPSASRGPYLLSLLNSQDSLLPATIVTFPRKCQLSSRYVA